ncbi:hypothetical protein [Sphingorhabdus sp.]
MRVEKEDARAGKTGMGVRYVLAVSLVLAVVAMIAVYLGVI